ncbi:MAG: hypothetical protein WDW36_000963 [Sanguina aurantia]
MMYDTRLTEAGAQGAREAAEVIAKLSPPPQLLVVSPMTRTLNTASLAFPNYAGPVIVLALATERLWLASDCGREAKVLEQEFGGGRYDFSELPEIWWQNGGSSDPLAFVPETDGFAARGDALQQWLRARPETSIAVVCHYGICKHLTGKEFLNCEVQSYSQTRGLDM